METVTLHTARLVLSPPTTDDVEAIFAACQDPAIQRYTTVPSPYERHHAEGFVSLAQSWWQAGTETTWAIRHDGALAGMLGIHGITRGSGELGYWMSRVARDRGLLTEACRAVIEWSLSAAGLGLTRLEWRAVVGNIPSARAARRLGFRYEGTLRGALVNGAGRRDDSWIAGLLTDDDRSPQPWPVLDD